MVPHDTVGVRYVVLSRLVCKAHHIWLRKVPGACARDTRTVSTSTGPVQRCAVCPRCSLQDTQFGTTNVTENRINYATAVQSTTCL